MAAALLIGTNAWAGTYNVGTTDAFEAAWAKSATEDVVINLTSAGVNLGKTMWLGTQAINGTAHSVEINLNGFPLTSSAANAFVLTHGTLKFSGNGQVTGTGTGEMIYITGSTNKDVDPSVDGANYFSHLIVGEGVTIANTQYYAAISIDGIKKGNTIAYNAKPTTYMPSKPKLDYITNIYANSETSDSRCAAYGVRLDIKGSVNGKKYGIKANGILGNPNWYFEKYQQPGNVVAFSSDLLPEGYTIAAEDVNYVPYIYIYPTARVTANAQKGSESKSPVALYASGFARWKVEGFVSGSVGALVKSGDVNFENATVEGTGESYSASIPSTSGTAACGSAIALESNTVYAGDINVTIGGDSKVTAQHGYAIDENVVTNDNQTKVDAITINGGVFQGGTIQVDPNDPSAGTMEAVMKVSEPTAIANQDPNEETTITIIGATASQGSAMIGDQTLADYLADATTEAEQGKTHITFVDNGQGGTVMVISQGEPPVASEAGVDTWNDGDAIDWKHDNPLDNDPMYGTIESDLTLAELQMTQSYSQELIVEEGVTFKVGRVILGSYAKITVKAGGTFIVDGDQGIVAPSVENIVLETQENQPAIFLFKPSVTSNRNPKATVKFTSKSFYTPEGYVFQRFGLPTKKDGLISVTGAGDPRTRFWSFDYSNNSWKAIGFIHETGSDVPLDITKMNDPFEYYQMMNFDATTPSGVVYTFTGSLLGNTEPNMQILANSWKGFANSYMGIMQLSELLKLIPNTVDKAVYTYNVDAVHGSWEPVTNLNSAGAKLNPMQPFLIRNRYDAAEVALDYGKTVYYPTTGETPPASAPSRAAVNDITMAKITIANENSTDYVIVAEDNEFTPSFDNGYDASKFMNDEVNLYVEAEENMSIFATNRLENTTLGVSSTLGGKYTITFSNVNGSNFVLVDNFTGAQIAMTEGSSYEFELAANTVNSRRFSIVPMAKVPTAIENTEVKANAKGVYSITGMYLGEDINVLPAGIYVVNGVKIVK